MNSSPGYWLSRRIRSAFTCATRAWSAGANGAVRMNCTAFFGGLKGVVDREHHVVDANFTDRGDQRRVGEHSSGGDRDVGPDVLRGQLFQRVLEIEDLEAESGRESWKGRNSPMCSRMTRASG